MIAKTWATVATIVAAVLFMLHFDNPFPLFQVPDKGHQILGVPEQYRVTVVRALGIGGLQPYGTFLAGIKQTLMDDGRWPLSAVLRKKSFPA